MMLLGFGYTNNSPCTTIPAGDPYRVSGNSCTAPSGCQLDFNPDGSVGPDVCAGTNADSSQVITQPGAQMPNAWWNNPYVLGVTGIALAFLGYKVIKK
jgi:hypothetical protein